MCKPHCNSVSPQTSRGRTLVVVSDSASFIVGARVPADVGATAAVGIFWIRARPRIDAGSRMPAGVRDRAPVEVAGGCLAE